MIGPSMSRSELIVFVKDPARDRVKTRLGSRIGTPQSVQFYRHCLAVLSDHLSQLQSEGLEPRLALTSAEPSDELKSIFGDVPHVSQGTGNIGQRLNHIDAERRKDGVERLLFIGSDAPSLPLDLIREVWNSLENHDCAIAPAEDGGFTTLGARKALPDLEQVRWSHEKTYEDVKSVCDAHGWSQFEGRTWYDVDRWNDVQKLMVDLKNRQKLGPAENALLSYCSSLAPLD